MLLLLFWDRIPEKDVDSSYLFSGSFFSHIIFGYVGACLTDGFFSLVSIGFESEILVLVASSAFSEVEVLGHSSFLGADIHALLEEKPRISQASS